MSWDLGISAAGDLVFSPSSDLQGISGTDLVQQRMLMRLKLRRGSWTYDDSESFGSQLWRLMSANPVAAAGQAEAYVREALRDMDDVVIDAISVNKELRTLTIRVDYHVAEVDVSVTEENRQQLEIAIPDLAEGSQ